MSTINLSAGSLKSLEELTKETARTTQVKVKYFKEKIDLDKHYQSQREQEAVLKMLSNHQFVQIVGSNTTQFPGKMYKCSKVEFAPDLGKPTGQVIEALQASDRRKQDRDSAVLGSVQSVQEVVHEHIQPILDDLRAVAKEDFRKASKADRRRKILKMIAENLRKLATLNLTLQEFLREKPFPSQPYCRPQAKEFFMAAKMGETMRVRKLLIGCKYLVYEYDQTRMTALHWAARRGRLEIGEALHQKLHTRTSRELIFSVSFCWWYSS